MTTNALMELAACPFCGGQAKLHSADDGESVAWWVQCIPCGSISGEKLAESTPDQEFAVASWNARPPSPTVFPELPKTPFSGPNGMQLFDSMHMHTYALRYADAIQLRTAASGVGEAFAYARQRSVDELKSGRCSGITCGEYSEMYERTVPLYLHPGAEAREAWVSVKDRLPENGVGVLVYTPGEDGGIFFDACDDGIWIEHSDHYDHYLSVGSGTMDCPIIGPSQEAPYTHWHAIPARPEDAALRAREAGA